VREENNPEAVVGNYTSIGHGTTFWGSVNYPSIANPKLACNRGRLHLQKEFVFGGSKGPIKIGNDVWMGTGCDVLGGVTIGDGAIVGMRTLVSKDVPPYAVVVGHPMVIKRYRFSPEIIAKLQAIKWWDWTVEVLDARWEDFLDVDMFVEKYYKEEQ